MFMQNFVENINVFYFHFLSFRPETANEHIMRMMKKITIKNETPAGKIEFIGIDKYNVSYKTNEDGGIGISESTSKIRILFQEL